VNEPRAFSWRAELSRKGIHLGSAIFPLSWSFGAVDRPTLLAILSAGLAVALMIEVLRRRNAAVARWFDAWFGFLLRDHERARLTGATWILGAMLLCVAVLPERAAISALWAGVFGDTAAALVGRAASARAAAQGKTWAGSVACAIASAIGPLWLAAASPLQSLAIGVASALAERPALRLDDNARVAIAAGLAAWGLGLT
jgi:dolichol kinase